MILDRHRVIFLHLPKTGGNSIQTLLLPFSSDRRVVSERHDGVDRFDIVGEHTSAKHANLQRYARSLGDRLGEYRIAIGCRNPLDRLVSLYFSPHRWLRRQPRWDRERFLAFLAEQRSGATFLQVDGQTRRPDWVIRYEAMQPDFAIFAHQAGLPLADAALPHVNRSAASELAEQARADPAVRRRVAAEFASEYELFGYPAD